MKEDKGTVYFLTTNRGKFAEASQVASVFGVTLKHIYFDKQEIQANELREIATHSANQASRHTRYRIVTEDAGFFVEALGGFPGPYSSFVLKTIGLKGLLKLLSNVRDRTAHFEAAVAYSQPNGESRCFMGYVKGFVSQATTGTGGFGFDPIFIPLKGNGRTFAEMNAEEKNALSHRATAFKKFFKWYLSKHSRSMR